MCLLFKDTFDKKVLLESKHAEINEVCAFHFVEIFHSLEIQST